MLSFVLFFAFDCCIVLFVPFYSFISVSLEKKFRKSKHYGTERNYLVRMLKSHWFNCFSLHFNGEWRNENDWNAGFSLCLSLYLVCSFILFRLWFFFLFFSFSISHLRFVLQFTSLAGCHFCALFYSFPLAFSEFSPCGYVCVCAPSKWTEKSTHHNMHTFHQTTKYQ